MRTASAAGDLSCATHERQWQGMAHCLCAVTVTLGKSMVAEGTRAIAPSADKFVPSAGRGAWANHDTAWSETRTWLLPLGSSAVWSLTLTATSSSPGAASKSGMSIVVRCSKHSCAARDHVKNGPTSERRSLAEVMA